jgi:hypothetical protein
MKNKNYKICRNQVNQLVILFLIIFTASPLFAQFTFTNASAIGVSGPSQAQINAAYLSTSLSGLVTVTNGIQEWVVPQTGLYKISASGARGGNATGSVFLPGNGAKMEGEFILTSGETIRILVGQMGQDRLYSGGGGGGTFVTRTPHNTLSSILVIAGGGGASSQDEAGLHGDSGLCGTFGNQSGPAQCNGDGGLSFIGNSGSGGGGFFTNGQNGAIGTGGTAYILGGQGGTTNNQQAGGFGGGGGQNGTGTYAASAGGGFSGGNGGNRAPGRTGGGGGGSYNSGLNQINLSGENNGHGFVIITPLNVSSIDLQANTIVSPASTQICASNNVPVIARITNASTVPIDFSNNPATVKVDISGTTTQTMTFIVNNNNINGNALLAGSAFIDVPVGNLNMSTAGIYNFIFSVTTVSDVNTANDTASMTSVVVNPSTVIISQPTSATQCEGTNMNFEVTASGYGILLYQWYKNGILIPNESAAIMVLNNLNPANAGMYTVEVTGNCGSETSISTNLTVNPLPNVLANASASSVCEGDQVTLFGSGALSYSWDNGVVNLVPFIPNQTLLYTVTGTDINGCINTDATIINLHLLPVVVANASASLVCEGDMVTFTGSGANIYNWNNGVIDGVPFKVSAGNTFIVTGIDVNGCINSDDVVIAVNPLPVVGLSSFEKTCIYYSPFLLTGGTPDGGNYASSGTTMPTNFFDPSLAGVGFHSVTYTYTDLNGCINSASSNIEVSNCLGVDQFNLSGLSMKIYPNPASSDFNLEISTPEKEEVEIMVYNPNGKLVFSDKLSLESGINKLALNSSQYARGIYLVNMFTKTEVLKQRIVLN